MSNRSRPTEADRRHLARALELAARGRYRVAPNPMVGAVVVRPGEGGERVVGEGWHPRVGGPHAERMALEAAGSAARGATLYVTLEPCTHHGRTPPCVEAVLEAGIARVVACHRDPNPKVPGGGFERLAEAGLEVAWGALVEPAVRLNHRFLIEASEGRPAVTLKWAMSLDGKIATVSGESQWISSPEGRRWALGLRREHDAVLVGSGTALADDPRLTRRAAPEGDPGDRDEESGEPILRAVLDRRLRLPPTARLLAEPGPVLVYARAGSGGGTGARRGELEERGAEVVPLEDPGPAAVLADLERRGVQSLLVEGGGEIHAAFVGAGLWDRLLVDLGGLLLGGRKAPSPVAGDGFPELAVAPRVEALELVGEIPHHGGDVILEGFRRGCLPALSQSVDG